jgi:hypothetical protein
LDILEIDLLMNKTQKILLEKNEIFYIDKELNRELSIKNICEIVNDGGN